MRRTRGGRPLETMKKRANRRNKSAKLARKANEQAKKVVEESEKLQRQIQSLSSMHQNEMEKIVFELIKVPEEKSKTTLLLNDYIGDFTIRLDALLQDPSRHSSMNQSFINFRKNLIRQYSEYANLLSNRSHTALDLSTKTPLSSNSPNQINNNEANRQMKEIISSTENIKLRPSSSRSSPSEILERINFAIQIADTLELITYRYLIKNSNMIKHLDLLIHKHVMNKSEMHDMTPTLLKGNRPSIIRELLHVGQIINSRRNDKKSGHITDIFIWLLDATDEAWFKAISLAASYYVSNPTPQMSCTLYYLQCQRYVFQLYFRFPFIIAQSQIKNPFIVKDIFIDNGRKREENEKVYGPSVITRMDAVLKNWDNIPDPTTYHEEHLDFNTWFTKHFPPKEFVRSEVERIQKKPSTAPISVRPSPMKVEASRPATGLTLAAYKPRLAQEQQAAIAAAQAAKASTGFPPKK